MRDSRNRINLDELSKESLIEEIEMLLLTKEALSNDHIKSKTEIETKMNINLILKAKLQDISIENKRQDEKLECLRKDNLNQQSTTQKFRNERDKLLGQLKQLQDKVSLQNYILSHKLVDLHAKKIDEISSIYDLRKIIKQQHKSQLINHESYKKLKHEKSQLKKLIYKLKTNEKAKIYSNTPSTKQSRINSFEIVKKRRLQSSKIEMSFDTKQEEEKEKEIFDIDPGKLLNPFERTNVLNYASSRSLLNQNIRKKKRNRTDNGIFIRKGNGFVGDTTHVRTWL